MRAKAWAEIGLDQPRPWRRPIRIALATGFGLFVLVQLAVLARYNMIGIDVSIYSQAVLAWFNGGDPWSVSVMGFMPFKFAAPPTSMLPYIPAALLPPPVGAALTIGGLAVLAAAALHRLGLPLWWLLFPPLAEALAVGNLDAAVFAVLVLGPRWLAPVLKTYAFVPLLRTPRVLAMAALAMAVTVPFLPWSTFLGQLGQISATLAAQNHGPTAWGSWPLVIVAIPALVALGWRGLWLAVPVLWPSTQLHYAAMAIPAIAGSPILALGFALPIPGAAALSVIVLALIERLPTARTALARAWGRPNIVLSP